MTAIAVVFAAGSGVGGAIAVAATSPSRPADSAAPNVRVQGDARVQGRFAVTGKLTTAVNVAGERRGERLTRIWTVRSESCHASDCGKLVVVGRLTDAPVATFTLSRVAAGQYRGGGAFFPAQRCRGRTVREGRRAAYSVTLTVTRREVINGLSYATGISAGYTNPSRSDRTACPLKPAHDAATFTATVENGLPVSTTGPLATTTPATTGAVTTTAPAETSPTETSPTDTSPMGGPTVTTISSTPSPTVPTETIPHAPTPQSASQSHTGSCGGKGHTG